MPSTARHRDISRSSTRPSRRCSWKRLPHGWNTPHDLVYSFLAMKPLGLLPLLFLSYCNHVTLVFCQSTIFGDADVGAGASATVGAGAGAGAGGGVHVQGTTINSLRE